MLDEVGGPWVYPPLLAIAMKANWYDVRHWFHERPLESLRRSFARYKTLPNMGEREISQMVSRPLGHAILQVYSIRQ